MKGSVCTCGRYRLPRGHGCLRSCTAKASGCWWANWKPRYCNAQIRADECSKNKTLEHKRPDGRACDTVLDELNLKAKCSWWGENAAYCSTEPTAEFIVGTWMKSQGHKDNMLMSRYTHVGIGVSVADNGAYYFIQVFAEQKKNTDWQ